MVMKIKEMEYLISNKIINYEVDPYLLGMLLKNQDFIDRSLSYEDSIDEFVRKDKKIRPWAYL